MKLINGRGAPIARPAGSVNKREVDGAVPRALPAIAFCFRPDVYFEAENAPVREVSEVRV